MARLDILKRTAHPAHLGPAVVKTSPWVVSGTRPAFEEAFQGHLVLNSSRITIYCSGNLHTSPLLA